MYNRKYNKKFITLKADSDRNKSGERNPTGSCVIETADNSSKIITYVQGIKRSNENEHFFVYLVSSNENDTVGVPIGEISISQAGKGMIKNDINANNVSGSGLPIEKFNVIAIFMKNDNNKKNNVLALEGFTEERVSWKNNFVEIEKRSNIENDENKVGIKKTLESKKNQEVDNASKEPVIKNIREIKKQGTKPSEAKQENQPEIKQEIKQENELKVASNKQDGNPHDTFKKISANFRKELDDLEKLGIINPRNEQEESKVDTKDLSNSSKMTDIDYMFANNQKLILDSNNKEIDWVRIGLNDLVLLPISSCLMMRNPFIVSCFRMYNHLILGREKNSNTYYLGIPDKYKENYIKNANDLGFNRFVPCQMVASSQAVDNYGYWLMEFN